MFNGFKVDVDTPSNQVIVVLGLEELAKAEIERVIQVNKFEAGVLVIEIFGIPVDTVY